ncbi:uncharacterized protein B0T15DRAFT_537561 [Chaetomium strumarium]|uniref:F-box domain-containing protein n=1 Tax=Chaetomium strumarium TaxID=1170767 RepID=A0AAJ0GRI5_9PEZI|nr:hypothetical protein B0T15DRAFT_537561 [Chaetomium strumarium]
MVGLLQLPNELLALIFGRLDAQGFSALRLTSKYAKLATLPAFIRRYFQTRYIMFSRLSLENFLEIARHPDFGPAVRTLELCTDHFVEFPSPSFHTARHEGDILLAIQEGRYPPAVSVGSIDDAHSSTDEEEDQSAGEESLETDEGNLSFQDSEGAFLDKTAYTSLWEEQENIITSGLAQAYITQALISLANIESVVISNMHRPWGALAHGRQTGLPPTNVLDDYAEVPFLGQVLRITLTAIATSGAALSSLAITAGLPREAIVPDILRPSESHLQYYKNLPPSLTELTLNVSAEAARRAEDRWADDVSAFIGMFQQLTQLDLVIRPVDFGPRVDRLKQLAPRLQIPNLQCLGLYKASCSVQGLGDFISRHRATLQSVTLVRVGVSGGIGHLRSLFALIRDHLPRLGLSIKSCTAGGLALLCRVEHENGEEFEDCFDVGGSHEAWTTAIQAIKTR